MPSKAALHRLQVEGLDSEGNLEAVLLSGSTVGAIAALGLSTALGYLRLLRVSLACYFLHCATCCEEIHTERLAGRRGGTGPC